MAHHYEVLDVLCSSRNDRRLVVAKRITQDGNEFSRDEQLVLRQESLSDAGWFTQSELVVELEQLAGLKLLLSSPMLKKNNSACNGVEPDETIRFDRFAAKRA